MKAYSGTKILELKKKNVSGIPRLLPMVRDLLHSSSYLSSIYHFRTWYCLQNFKQFFLRWGGGERERGAPTLWGCVSSLIVPSIFMDIYKEGSLLKLYWSKFFSHSDDVCLRKMRKNIFDEAVFTSWPKKGMYCLTEGLPTLPEWGGKTYKVWTNILGSKVYVMAMTAQQKAVEFYNFSAQNDLTTTYMTTTYISLAIIWHQLALWLITIIQLWLFGWETNALKKSSTYFRKIVVWSWGGFQYCQGPSAEWWFLIQSAQWLNNSHWFQILSSIYRAH